MSVTTSKPPSSATEQRAVVAREMVRAVLRPQSFGELVQFANMASKSGMVPKDYIGKPEAIMVAVQMGSELGLAPMQAIQNIAVVNGRPAVWGDAMPGLVKASGVCQDIIESIEGEGENMVAVCVAHRVGAHPVTVRFSVADAKKALLWNKPGPWTQYPKRMMQMRARGFALRDAFPDVLRGLISSEEAADISDNVPYAGPTITATAVEVTETDQQQTTQPRRTARQFLDELETELRQATDAAAVARIQGRKDVQTALNTLTNGAAERLNDMLDAALARHAEPAPDAPDGEYGHDEAAP